MSKDVQVASRYVKGCSLPSSSGKRRSKPRVTSHPSERLASRRPQTVTIGERVTREPWRSVGWSVRWHGHRGEAWRLLRNWTERRCLTQPSHCVFPERKREQDPGGPPTRVPAVTAAAAWTQPARPRGAWGASVAHPHGGLPLSLQREGEPGTCSTREEPGDVMFSDRLKRTKPDSTNAWPLEEPGL